MPVLNGEKYLAEAIQSVLQQTLTNFELILVNDGSKDKTKEIIKSFNDPRIVYLENVTNLGLSKSFNLAIAQAKGKYIARMDADDVATGERFDTQLTYFKSHPEVDILGSAITLIDENGKEINKLMKPETHLEIKWQSLFSTPLIHSTVLGKTHIFKENPYNENLHNSEDYELWSRLLFETETHFANINEPLLKYRTYPNSFTQTLNLDKRIVSAHNSIRNIERYLKLSDEEKRLVVNLRQERNVSILGLATLWFMYLKASFHFCHQENLSWRKCLRIHFYLLPQLLFLLKYKTKQILKRM